MSLYLQRVGVQDDDAAVAAIAGNEALLVPRAQQALVSAQGRCDVMTALLQILSPLKL